MTLEGVDEIPQGKAIQRIIRINELCEAVVELSREITIAEARALASDRGHGAMTSELLRADASSQASGKRGLPRPMALVAGGPLHMYLRIKDGAGLNLTSIDPHNFSYGYGGGVITSSSHSATVNRASDTTGHCGGGYYGWSLQAGSLSISGGGVGSTFIDSLAHQEFSYNGIFSNCDPNTYYNTLDTKLTGFGNGSPSSCAYRTQLRNTFFGWYQETICWDAYNYTFPPAF